MKKTERITIDPGICNGKPVSFAGFSKPSLGTIQGADRVLASGCVLLCHPVSPGFTRGYSRYIPPGYLMRTGIPVEHEFEPVKDDNDEMTLCLRKLL